MFLSCIADFVCGERAHRGGFIIGCYCSWAFHCWGTILQMSELSDSVNMLLCSGMGVFII